MSRENYYFDLLKPEYNVLKKAYSLLGYKHTGESLKKMKQRKVLPKNKLMLSLTHKNKIVDDVTRAKLSSALKEFYSKSPKSEDRIANIKKATVEREAVAVSVLNTKTNEIRYFNNKTEAGAFLKVSHQAITNSIKRNKPVASIYIVKVEN